MDSNICDVFYSQRFHQHFSAATETIFKMTLLLRECKRTNVLRLG